MVPSLLRVNGNRQLLQSDCKSLGLGSRASTRLRPARRPPQSAPLNKLVTQSILRLPAMRLWPVLLLLSLSRACGSPGPLCRGARAHVNLSSAVWLQPAEKSDPYAHAAHLSQGEGGGWELIALRAAAAAGPRPAWDVRRGALRFALRVSPVSGADWTVHVVEAWSGGAPPQPLPCASSLEARLEAGGARALCAVRACAAEGAESVYELACPPLQGGSPQLSLTLQHVQHSAFFPPSNASHEMLSDLKLLLATCALPPLVSPPTASAATCAPERLAQAGAWRIGGPDGAVYSPLSGCSVPQTDPGRVLAALRRPLAVAGGASAERLARQLAAAAGRDVTHRITYRPPHGVMPLGGANETVALLLDSGGAAPSAALAAAEAHLLPRARAALAAGARLLLLSPPAGGAAAKALAQALVEPLRRAGGVFLFLDLGLLSAFVPGEVGEETPLPAAIRDVLFSAIAAVGGVEADAAAPAPPAAPAPAARARRFSFRVAGTTATWRTAEVEMSRQWRFGVDSFYTVELGGALRHSDAPPALQRALPLGGGAAEVWLAAPDGGSECVGCDNCDPGNASKPCNWTCAEPTACGWCGDKGCRFHEQRYAAGPGLAAAADAMFDNRTFDWLLQADAETVWFVDNVDHTLAALDPGDAHYIAEAMWPLTDSACVFPGQPAFTDDRYNASCVKAPAAARGGCTPADVFGPGTCASGHLQEGPHGVFPGGNYGLILSRGLLDRISTAQWAECVRCTGGFECRGGGDTRIGDCLWRLGFAPTLPPRNLSSDSDSERLGVDLGSTLVRFDQAARAGDCGAADMNRPLSVNVGSAEAMRELEAVWARLRVVCPG